MNSLSAFPTIVLSRESVGAAAVSGGRVELVVVSRIETAVSIPGIISCNGDEDCPEGEACGLDRKCG